MLTQMQARSRNSFLADRSIPSTRAVDPPPRWFVSIRSGITSLWSMIGRWRARRRAIAELRSLDDRSLRDIGLLRCEIDSLPRVGPWE
jgi:uncharacterized protein YjiS (DUF1127 family)